MARTRRAAASAAVNTLAEPVNAETVHTAKSRPFAPAQKVHKAPRLNRGPLSTLDTNARSAKKQSKQTGKQAAGKQVVAPPDEPLVRSQSPALTIATQALDRTQRVAESSYGSNNAPETTSATEHSILALKNFRRRPRQPSMLNMVKQRLASARSSLAAPDAPVFDSDDSLDLDDFLPDAAGTPMHGFGLEVVTQPSRDDTASRTSQHRRKRAADETEPGSLDTVDRSLLKYRTLVGQSSEESMAANDEELLILASQASRVTSTPEPDNYETTLNITELAAASSPLSASSELSSLQPGTQHTDVHAPPMSQLTPPRKTRTATKAVKPPSSAVLQSLLPKRRKHFNTGPRVPTLRLSDEQDDERFELPSSPVHGDVDTSEYAHSGHRKAAAAIAGLKAKTSRVEKRKVTRSKANPSRNERKGDSNPHSRTYSRRSGDDNADDDLGEPTATIDEALSSKELQAARKKFEEIDQWEMEFETLTTEESRSSSQNWR